MNKESAQAHPMLNLTRRKKRSHDKNVKAKDTSDYNFYF